MGKCWEDGKRGLLEKFGSGKRSRSNLDARAKALIERYPRDVKLGSGSKCQMGHAPQPLTLNAASWHDKPQRGCVRHRDREPTGDLQVSISRAMDLKRNHRRLHSTESYCLGSGGSSPPVAIFRNAKTFLGRADR